MGTLLAARAVSLAKDAGGRFSTIDFPLDPLTDVIVATLRRPTSAAPLAWDETGLLEVAIVITIDGKEHRCTGRARGGIQRADQTRDGGPLREIAEYSLVYRPTWGFFGAREGKTQRLGERALLAYTVRAELVTLEGSAETELTLKSSEAPAPDVPFKNSVAFDAATDAQESGGDGVLTLTHTSTGSNRGVFVGVGTGKFDNVGASPTSVTYPGATMTEQWDINSGTRFYNAGYTGVAQNTGAQTVTSNVTGLSGTFHAMGVISMTGVDQTTPVGTAVTTNASTANPSVTVASVGTDDMVVDNIHADPFSATPAAGADQTERYSEIETAQAVTKGSTQPGTAGGVMSWTQSGTDAKTLGAIAFKPSTGGTTDATFSSDGAGTMTMAGAATAAAEMSMSGASTMVMTGAAISASDLNAAGTGTLTMEGASLAAAALTSDGSSTVEWVGASIAGGDGAFDMQGSSTVEWVGASTAGSALGADGAGDAAFVGTDGSAAPVEIEFPDTGVPAGDGGAWPKRSALRRKRLREEDDEILETIRALAPSLMQHRRH